MVVDENLPPSLADALVRSGHVASHWSSIGNPRAPDREILAWASDNAAVVVTQDLGFAALMVGVPGSSAERGLLRTRATLAPPNDSIVCEAIERFRGELATGCLLTIDAQRQRVRVLPLDRMRLPD